MSNEIVARYLVEGKVKKAILPEVQSIGMRISHLAEEILEDKNEKENLERLKEIIDAGYQLRALADALR